MSLLFMNYCRLIFLYPLLFLFFASLPPSFLHADESREKQRMEHWLKGHDLNLDAIERSKKLDISGKNIYELPGLISAFSDITEINASNANLDSLPEEIGDLKAVRHIDLEHNKLKSLPEEIGDLDNLMILKLRHNPYLTRLPESLTKLKKLTKLFIDDSIQNKQILKQIPNLRVLFVGGKGFTTKGAIESYLNQL